MNAKPWRVIAGRVMRSDDTSWPLASIIEAMCHASGLTHAGLAELLRVSRSKVRRMTGHAADGPGPSAVLDREVARLTFGIAELCAGEPGADEVMEACRIQRNARSRELWQTNQPNNQRG